MHVNFSCMSFINQKSRLTGTLEQSFASQNYLDIDWKHWDGFEYLSEMLRVLITYSAIFVKNKQLLEEVFSDVQNNISRAR